MMIHARLISAKAIHGLEEQLLLESHWNSTKYLASFYFYPIIYIN